MERVSLTAADEGKLEPAVVSALYVEHAEELQRFLLGLLRDAQLASDVLQATFTKAVQAGHTSQESSRKAWLFRVAYNEAMAIRRRQSVDGRAVEKLAWTRDFVAHRSDEPLIRFETVELVRAAIEELPAPQQQVLRMRIYEEKTFAEIAEELDIPLGTALGRMRNALQKLRRSLEERNLD